MEPNWLRLEKRHLVENYGSLQGFTPREWNYLGRRMARM
jgi:hypothetical protein